MKKHSKRLVGVALALMLVLCLGLMAGCGGDTEADGLDLIIKSTNIYTVADDAAISGAIGIKGNEIVAIGSAEEIEAQATDQTQVYDMGDQLVLPGFIEGHSHIEGPAFGMGGVDLLNVESPEACAERVAEYVAANPDEEGWIFGFGWYFANWEDGTLPDKSYLDVIDTDRPIFLLDFDYHNGWFNSAGLAELGITAETPDPDDGRIFRDADGNPTGYIQDGVMWDAYDIVYEMIENNMDEYMSSTFELYASLGITGVNDMGSWTPDDTWLFDYMTGAEQNGTLGTRVFFTFGLMENDIDSILEAQQTYTSDMFKLSAVKAYLDGVGSVSTAAMLQPYGNDPDNSGEFVCTEEEFAEKILAADLAGLNIHVHACGDRSVRFGLDTYEQAIATNTERTDRRHTLDHCDTIAAADLPRFAELGVGANITPDFMAPTTTWEKNPYIKVYDEQVRTELWLTNSLIESGARVTYGSDAPCSNLNPMVQIFRAANRVTNDGLPSGGYMPEEKVNVADSIRAYTINPAYEAGMESKLGTLEVGKLADIIVLDQDILTCDPMAIADTQVVLTLVDGEVRYQK